MSAVLDSSALLAFIWDEPGKEKVAPHIPGAAMSTVNLAEVASKLSDRGSSEADIQDLLLDLQLDFVPFDEAQGLAAGRLRASTRTLGLSLGDRACLGLALRLDAEALTAENAWSVLDIGANITFIR